MRIEDFGKGIPDEIKERVFEEGFAYGETGRSGLGLYIVKKVVERYGGRVEIENNSPRGTVVILRLIPY
jgi:two-component system sensor kinase